jgi:putative ribosome biogenesis GTPase RsgA
VVVALSQGKAEVEYQNQVILCRLKKELAVEQQTQVALGDEVKLDIPVDGMPVVIERLPRRSVLSRPDPQSPRIERVIAANVDTVVLGCL